MKIRNIFIIVLIFIISLFLNNSTFAQNYKGKEFPSEKHLKYLNYSDAKFVKSLGKHKNKDGSYLLFFLWERKRSTGMKYHELRKMKILQLDTKLWIAFTPLQEPQIIRDIK